MIPKYVYIIALFVAIIIGGLIGYIARKSEDKKIRATKANMIPYSQKISEYCKGIEGCKGCPLSNRDTYAASRCRLIDIPKYWNMEEKPVFGKATYHYGTANAKNKDHEHSKETQ